MKSMTGYGSFQQGVDGYQVLLEIRTVNHRFREVSFHADKLWLTYEMTFKKMIQRKIDRGKVDLYLHVEQLPSKVSDLEWSKIDVWLKRMKEIKNRYQLPGEIEIRDLLHFPELFQENPEKHRDWTPVFEEIAEKACERLLEMRTAEGANLQRDLLDRIHRLQKCIALLQAGAKRAPQTIEEKLKQRLASLSLHTDIEPQRFMAEVVFYVEKYNVGEELVRLESHADQFEKWLDHVAEPVGKKLDFLLQEMQREINTLGAKVNDGEMSQHVLNGKSEIEKMREQVQNVE